MYWKPLVMVRNTVAGDDEGISGSKTGRHMPSKPVLFLIQNGTGSRSNDETKCLMLWLMMLMMVYGCIQASASQSISDDPPTKK